MAKSKIHFTAVDIALTLVSLITYILDVSTDILVCIQLLLDDYKIWGWFMVVFIAVPALLMSVFSLTWHIYDKTATSCVILSHIFLMSPVQRYVNVIRLGMNSYRSRKATFTQKALRAQSDVSILRLVEAFLESAPQLVMQLYILVYKKNGDWFIGVSAVCSLVSMTWAMTAYCDSQRRAHSCTYSHRLIRLLLHWAWQLFMAAGRIAAFVFFACVLHNWVFAVMGGHWLIAFIWISVRGTDFGSSCCEKLMFRMVCAFIYIFVFLNLNEGASRKRVTAYYLLFLLENAGMVAVYLLLGDSPEAILISCCVVFGGFFIGLGCMVVYYTFLHPSRAVKGLQRCMQPKRRPSCVSDSLVGVGPQIFSIESPRAVATIEDGVLLDPSVNTSSSHTSAVTAQHAWVLENTSGSSQSLEKAPKSSKQTLRMAWQSGMDSSSDSTSTSSLAATENHIVIGKRLSLSRSEHSHDFPSSDNPVLKRNDLSKPPKMSSEAGFKILDSSKPELPGGIGENCSLNICSGGSLSPALSRGSWARSSDHNTQSLILDGFTVLGFDDSSSVDRKTSDCSSFGGQQKSLSPLNVANIWKDLNSRLRVTIAAAVAAATGHLSSNESTPYKSRSVSSRNSTISGHDDSLNSTCNNRSSLNHNTAFMDSGSSYKDKVEYAQSTINQDSSHTGAHSSLQDILELLDQECNLNLESTDKSYRKFAGETMRKFFSQHELSDAEENTISAKTVSTLAIDCSSPYSIDSTLTASKLGTERSTSYLKFQRRNLKHNDSFICIQSDNPMDLSKTPPKSETTIIPANRVEKNCKDDSPFTDQELVSVMAKSLQSYIGGIANGSHNPEREGLALTLEDLRISRETTPNQSPISEIADEAWKDRGAYSVLHDSNESSPVSSASKMNRTFSLKKADAQLSPNPFKQLEVSPKKSLSQNDVDDTLATIPHSLALKSIMESYGSSVIKSSHFATPLSQEPFHAAPIMTHSSRLLVADKFSPQFTFQNNKPSSESRLSNNCQMPVAKSLEEDQSLISDKSHSSRSSSLPTHRNMDLSSRSKRIQKLFPQNFEATAQARGGVSVTKKLDVSLHNFHVTERNSSSSYPQNHLSQDVESDSGSEIGGYVAGQYCPPLCGNNEIESQQHSELRNLDCDRRKTYDLNCIKKPVPFEEVHKKDKLNDFKKEIIRRDSETKRQKSNFVHLHQPAVLNSNSISSKSPSKLQYRSPVYHNKDNFSELDTPVIQNTGRFQQRLDASKHGGSGKRGFAQPSNVDEMTEAELHLSAKHIADYYSEALRTTPNKPSCQGKPRNSVLLQSQLHVHNRRQPLQRLENSQLISPEESIAIARRKVSDIHSDDLTNSDLLRNSFAPMDYLHHFRHVIERQNLQQNSSHGQRHKLLFDTRQKKDNPAKVTPKPPVYRLGQSPPDISISKLTMSRYKDPK